MCTSMNDYPDVLYFYSNIDAIKLKSPSKRYQSVLICGRRRSSDKRLKTIILAVLMQNGRNCGRAVYLKTKGASCLLGCKMFAAMFSRRRVLRYVVERHGEMIPVVGKINNSSVKAVVLRLDEILLIVINRY